MAKRAFDHCSEDYARYRPGYPDEVARLADELAPPGPAADVGAGPGIFTRQLAAVGRKVLAVDPSKAMLAHVGAAGTHPIPAICATAEALPFQAGTVALVTCAQSFHWLNPPLALAEFARVLVPGGILLIVWNNRDPDDPFVSAFDWLIRTWNPAYRREYRQQDWASKVAASRAFAPAKTGVYRWAWSMSVEAFVGYARSISYIRNVIARADWRAFEEALRGLLAAHFAGGRCQIPLRTDLWWARRIA